MKLENTGVMAMDLEFESPQPGISICMVMDGIEKRTNEKSGKTTLRIPMMIDQVVEGPDTNKDLTLSHFVPIETVYGEKQIANLLTMLDLVESFAKRFTGEVDVTDDTFVNALKLKLSGKFIQVTHDVRKDQNGKERTNIVRLEAVGAGKKKAAKSKSAAPNPETENENW